MKKIGMVAVALLLAASVSQADVVLAVDYGDMNTCMDNYWVYGIPLPSSPKPDGWYVGGFDPGFYFGWTGYMASFRGIAEKTGTWNQAADQLPAGFALQISNGDGTMHPLHSTSDNPTSVNYAGVTLDMMYWDGFQQGAWGGSKVVTQSLSGLAPSTKYSMTVWSWGSNYNNITSDWTDVTGGGSVALGSITSMTAEPTSDSSYSLTFDVTSDGDGVIIIQSNGAASYPINGFMIQTAEIPEPGTLLLLGTGALGAFGFIRRRMMK